MVTPDHSAALTLLNGVWSRCLQNCFTSSRVTCPATWSSVYDPCNIQANCDAINTCMPACNDPLGVVALITASEACLPFTPASSPVTISIDSPTIAAAHTTVPTTTSAQTSDEQATALAFLNATLSILSPCLQGCFMAFGVSYPVIWSAVYDSSNIQANKDVFKFVFRPAMPAHSMEQFLTFAKHSPQPSHRFIRRCPTATESATAATSIAVEPTQIDDQPLLSPIQMSKAQRSRGLCGFKLLSGQRYYLRRHYVRRDHVGRPYHRSSVATFGSTAANNSASDAKAPVATTRPEYNAIYKIGSAFCH
ncbi:hypothetical protein HDU81_008329 [Chytriomyces hyalinus]|nr:hypothetical protein HDU81_008329 [Chytriomyces hyalinus]